MGYVDSIIEISGRIHTGLVDFAEPREESPMPTQASSESITNKQQGDWAEDVLFHAINGNSSNLVAVRYGRSEDLVAGDEGFELFYSNYQKELDEIGKRPDILLFKKEDFNPLFGTNISNRDRAEIDEYVKKAIAGIEVRSSSFLIGKYNDEVNRLVSENVRKAIVIRDKNKTTIKIPAQDGLCLAETVKEPDHHSVRKELGRGRLLFYVKFDGGAAYLDKNSFDHLFGCKL